MSFGEKAEEGSGQAVPSWGGPAGTALGHSRTGQGCPEPWDCAGQFGDVCLIELSDHPCSALLSAALGNNN